MHAASLPAPAVFLKRTRAPASRLPPGVVIGVRSAPPGRVPPSSSLPQRPVRSPGSRTPDARRRAARKDGAGCVDAHQEPSTLILFWRHRLAVSPQRLSRPPWQVGLQAAAPEGGRERSPSFPTPARPPLAPPPPSAASRSHFRVSLHTRPCTRTRQESTWGNTVELIFLSVQRPCPTPGSQQASPSHVAASRQGWQAVSTGSPRSPSDGNVS